MKSLKLVFKLTLATLFSVQVSFAQNVPQLRAAGVTEHNDNPLSESILIWDESNSAWDSTSWTQFLYYPSGKMEKSVVFNYDSLGVLHPFSRRDYHYDTAGINEMQLWYFWNANAWELTFKTTHQYDVPETHNVWASWELNGAVWDSISTYHVFTTYDGTGKKSQEETYLWEANPAPGTVLRGRVEFQYNAQHLVDTATQWSFYAAWEPLSRMINQQWSGQKVTESKTQLFQQGTWEDYSRLNTVYDAHESYTSTEERFFQGQWRNSNIVQEIFDAEGHKTSRTYSVWNDTTWTVNTIDSTQYVYDGQGRTLEYLVYNYYFGTYTPDRWHVFTDFFLNQAESTPLSTELFVFPNPSSTEIRCRLKDVKYGPVSIALYDVSGRLRMKTVQNYHGQELVIPIDLVQENGVYVMEITTQSGTAFEKVQILR